MTLTTEQGLITVNIGSNITIQKTMLANRWDLHEGQFLSIIGSQDVSSDITATSILIRPPGQNNTPTPPPGAYASPGRTPRQQQITNGTITHINGDMLILTTGQGAVKVKVSPDTTMRRVATGAISDLLVGVALSVTGSQDINGNINAISIRIRPQSQETSPNSSAGSYN